MRGKRPSGLGLLLSLASGFWSISVRAQDLALPVPAPMLTVVSIPSFDPTVPQRRFKIPHLVTQPSRFASGPELNPSYVDGLADLYGDRGNFDRVCSSEHIEVMALRPNVDAPNAPDDYLEGPRLTLSTDDAAWLRFMLTSDATFNWKEDVAGIPSYEYRVRFGGKGANLDIDFSFAFRTLRVSCDGREIATRNFEFGSTGLVADLSQYFPAILHIEPVPNPRVAVESYNSATTVAARLAYARREQRKTADLIEGSLAAAKSVEIFRIDPAGGYQADEVRENDPRERLEDRWPVIGAKRVLDPLAIKEIAAALVQGIRERDPARGFFFCFNPRHAFRWESQGRTLTLIVCYECQQGLIDGLPETRGFLTSSSPQGILDEIFARYGLLKAK